MRWVVAAALGVALAASWPPFPGHAAGDGYVVALNCGEMPMDAALQVVAPDDAPGTAAVTEAIEDALEDAGYALDPAGALRVGFDVASRSDAPGRGPADGDPADSERYGEGQDRVRVPLYSSDRRAAATPVGEVELTVTVHAKADGHCLWQGRAVYGLRGADPNELARRLVPFLVPHVGERVDLKPIELE